MKSARSKACQLLLKFNYDVYIPISGDELLVIEKDGKLLKCLCRKAIIKDSGNPLLHIATRCGSKKYPIDAKVADFIAAVTDELIWIIAVSDIAEFDCLRLGSKWNHCLLGDNKIDDKRKKRITTVAKRAIKRMELGVADVEKEEQDALEEKQKLEDVFKEN